MRPERNRSVESDRVLWDPPAMVNLTEVRGKYFTKNFNAPLDGGRLISDRLTSTVIPVLRGGVRDCCGSCRRRFKSLLWEKLEKFFHERLVGQLGSQQVKDGAAARILAQMFLSDQSDKPPGRINR